MDQIQAFFDCITTHWQFCLLHFLEFAIWGSWIVVLANMLEHRGFSRVWIGRIYGAIPIGSMISSLAVGTLVDRFFEVQIVLGIAHLIGAGFLFAMAYCNREKLFYALSIAYAIFFAPTLVLVNSMIFKNDAAVFGGEADSLFAWIRVFGTIGWIAGGLSLIFILKKGQPVNERPLLLAGVLSIGLGIYSFTLPSTPPVDGAEKLSLLETATSIFTDSFELISNSPAFFLVTLVAAMAMGLYFAFAPLYLEKSGIPSRTVGPVMTLGQWIEIFFLLTLPLFLGKDEKNMNWVLLIGITAWALRFGMFAIGKPIALVLCGVAIHGICFDFFFGAGMINANKVAPVELKATAQGVYGFLVYGLGMFLGSELSGWFNSYLSRKKEGVADAPQTDGESASGEDDVETNWSLFWWVPCGIVAVGAILFMLFWPEPIPAEPTKNEATPAEVTADDGLVDTPDSDTPDSGNPEDDGSNP